MFRTLVIAGALCALAVVFIVLKDTTTLSGAGGLQPPPAEPRPAWMKPAIKWLPESPRYLAARREHYAASRDLSQLDLGLVQLSRQQRYRVRAERAGTTVLNQFQAWTLRVETPDGRAVENALLNVVGGMPQHGHGMPSQPRVTPGAAPGEYRVEGLQFSMPGWWEVHVYVSKDRVDDIATFNLVLE